MMEILCNKMTKKLIFIFIVTSLFLIVGCSSGTDNERPITDVDIRKGVVGLEMDFVKNAPPLSIFEETSFPIAINLRNRGADKILKGILVFGFEKTYINGINEKSIKDIEKLKGDKTVKEAEIDGLEKNKESADISDFDQIDKDINTLKNKLDEIEKRLNELKDIKIEFDVDGKSILSPIGDDIFITIDAEASKIGEQSETRPSTILATTCYSYQTVFGSTVCIDTDIYGIRKGKKVCTVNDLSFSEGQGGPVEITKVESKILPDGDNIKLQFLIHIENNGNGEVIKLSKVEEACSSVPLEYKDFNTIKISATLSGDPLNCSSDENFIRLKEKRDVVRCTSISIGRNRDTYTAPLNVELDYGYTFTISKNIIIEKVLTY